MKLEVGMYVRSDMGIGKVIVGEEIDFGIKGKSPIRYRTPIDKSSHNIIDLIEVGDYVNGYLVVGKDSQMVNGELKPIIYTNEQEYWCGGWKNKRFDFQKRNNVQSMLTKEQYNANAYIIKE